ncbi:undecaprenyl pyrophosphate synthase [Apilactobacillus ozensis DSM 23829 = JCM 17196]|uniref:Isoprenyl transferase n=1 Tax=Apilactobacillus ozensis DSM 23829 = JCM 17196 TaxID=1423781 RepID=A0A0R2ALR5_9LACO|nr:undecaprenyl pyrophosphate synthase [Apilactobacillus ozensis DSM 23829 = JCM 17196]
MMFKSKNVESFKIDNNNIPKHVAIIMDGNGRWAKARHMPRIAGHKKGMNTVKTITKAASALGIKVLTLYAFSTENWRRPDKEVNYLMGLPSKFFNDFIPDLIANNVKVQVMGYINQLPEQTQQAVKKAIEATANCDGMILNFALNYGAQDEIVTSIQKIARLVKNNEIDIDDISKETVQNNLMTTNLGKLANPDLLIRTSGEKRLSNFLLWQVAYSEFVFRNENWPDFDAEILSDCILEYQNRHRRFGGLK